MATFKQPSNKRLLYPLDTVYARAGVVLPDVTVLAPDQIPSPYKSLLVHDLSLIHI